jgi:hypothetical protein
MQGYFCHMVAVVLKRTLALAGDTHALPHQHLQRFKSCYSIAGPVNQVLFFICINGL